MPFEDESFDFIVMADVIEHIEDERGKYIRNLFAKLKKGGILFITGTPNLIYPFDFHTTQLFLVPWLPPKMAYKYAVFRGKCKKSDNPDTILSRGNTFWQIKKWLRNENYEILNLRPKFTSTYLKSHNRLNSFKRRLLFKPYAIIETICCKFSIPITAFMPFIQFLFIRKS